MTLQSDCEICVLKKRKCGRESPQCRLCLTSGEKCAYKRSTLAATANRSKALENRLRKLEAIVQALNLDIEGGSDDGAISNPASPLIPKAKNISTAMSNSNLKSSSPMSASVSSSSNSSSLDAPRPDLEELFFSTGQSYLFLQEDDSRKAIQESHFLRFACYTLASTVAPPQMVPFEFGSRAAMAEAYFKRSESFLRKMFKKPSYHTVLGLFGLILYCTRTQRAPEAFYYYSVGIRIALSLGLNNEATYRDAGLDEKTKETMRATWWTIYMGDRLLAALRFELPLIKDRECLVNLPSSPLRQAHPQDHFEALEIAIMSSEHIYIPTPRDLSLDSYLLILVKINSRIIDFSQGSQNDVAKQSSEENLFKEALLLSSLDCWIEAVPLNVLQEVSGDEPPSNPKVVWKNAFMMILYYCMRMYIPKRRLVRNIEQNQSLAASSSACRDVFISTSSLTAILQGFLKHNPSFLYVPQFVAPCLFGAGLVTLLISRLALSPGDAAVAELSLQTIRTCINQHAILFNIAQSQNALLEQLATCKDPLLLCIAIKSLKNIQGESKTSISSDILLAHENQEGNSSEDDEQFPIMQPTEFQMASTPSSAFTAPEFLQDVAMTTDPFGSLMLCGATTPGSQMNGLDAFQSIFGSPNPRQ